MFGYDYGIKPSVMIVGDISFNEYIQKAKILGFGYISIPQNALENVPLEVALIFENEVYGKKAMQCFMNWINASNGNGDALGLDIIEHKDDNGYTLCFYQDIDCLIKSTVPEHIREWVTPLYAGFTYFKVIDNVSENFTKFKKALKFSKCHILAGSRSRVYTEYPAIVKSKMNVFKEGNIPENSHLQVYGVKKGISIKNGKKEFDKVMSKDAEENREKNIKYFYPITYQKVTNQGYLNKIVSELGTDYDRVIILQAICNLTLYNRLEKEGRTEVLGKDYYMEILQYLLDSYESIRSYFPDEGLYTKEMIIEQIKLDKKVLMNKFK